MKTFTLISLMMLTLLSFVVVSNMTQGLSDSQSFGFSSLTLLPLMLYTMFTN